MVTSCSCGGFSPSPSGVISPVLVSLLQGCLQVYSTFVSFSTASPALCSSDTGWGGGVEDIVASLFAFWSLCSIRFVLHGVCVAFRSFAFSLSSGGVRYFLRLFSPRLALVSSSPGSFFAHWALFTSLLFVGFPCVFPATLLSVLLLHSALLTFSFVLFDLRSALLVSLYSASIFRCGWATPAAIPGFWFPLLVVP